MIRWRIWAPICSLLAFASIALAQQSVTYTYDELGRVISATYPNGSQITYQYDAAGNRVQHVVSATTGNHAPTAVNDSQGAASNTPATFDPRTNDSDPDSDPITITAKTDGAKGTVSIGGGGTSLTYTPTSGQTGADSFTYTISDPSNATATATVSMMITAGNNPPVAVGDTATVAPTIAATLDVRANDSDPDGHALTISNVSMPSKGTAQISGGNIVYTANAGTTGTDTFNYTISDGNGGTATATVTITINSSPLAVADSANAVPTIAATINVRANDSDPDGDTLTVAGTTTPTKGAASVSNNNVIYTANAGTSGTDTFNYTVSDGQGGSASATITITIAANQPPVAVNDSGSVTAATNAGLIITLDPRANDSDPNGDSLTVTAKTNGTYGSVTILGDGTSVRYQRTSNYPTQSVPTKTDSFTYTISDGNGGTATATVNVSVTRTFSGGGGCGGNPCP